MYVVHLKFLAINKHLANSTQIDTDQMLDNWVEKRKFKMAIFNLIPKS